MRRNTLLRRATSSSSHPLQGTRNHEFMTVGPLGSRPSRRAARVHVPGRAAPAPTREPGPGVHHSWSRLAALFVHFFLATSIF